MSTGGVDPLFAIGGFSDLAASLRAEGRAIRRANVSS